jgi:hypothetical protein
VNLENRRLASPQCTLVFADERFFEFAGGDDHPYLARQLSVF